MARELRVRVRVRVRVNPAVDGVNRCCAESCWNSILYIPYFIIISMASARRVQ